MNQAVEAVNHQSGELNCPPRIEGVPPAARVTLRHVGERAIHPHDARRRRQALRIAHQQPVGYAAR